jgi:hypothetical protein
MWHRFAINVCAFALTVCACTTRDKAGPAASTAPLRLFEPAAEPQAARIELGDLPYFLAQMKVAAESPLSVDRAPEIRWNYRVLGATQQGNCRAGCPPSTILVVISNYDRGTDVRLFRVDGIRFWQFGRVTSYVATTGVEPFLKFVVTSHDLPGNCRDFEVQVSPERATVVIVGRNTTVFGCAP